MNLIELLLIAIIINLALIASYFAIEIYKYWRKNNEQ